MMIITKSIITKGKMYVKWSPLWWSVFSLLRLLTLTFLILDFIWLL